MAIGKFATTEISLWHPLWTTGTFSGLVFILQSYFFLDFFKGRLSNDELFFHFFRFSGTLGYPTEFGCFLLIPLIHLTEQRKLFSTLPNILVALTCSVGVLASASRAALLMGFVYALVYVGKGLFKILLKFKVNFQYLGILVLLISIGLVIFLAVQFQREQLSIVGYVVDFSRNDALFCIVLKKFLFL